MKIALAGNPNSGKTTMYNALTGGNEKVGNWAGVTVEKKEHAIKRRYAGAGEIIAVDLPGAYSMSPFTSEESITRDYVKNESPDAIINIVDASNLSRSLFFTTQLLSLGIPVVVALNKSDVNEKKGTQIDAEKLSELLGCSVIPTVSLSSRGLCEVVAAAVAAVGSQQAAPFCEAEIDASDRDAVAAEDRRRFLFVNNIVSLVEQRRVFTKDRNFQDKIDAVLTNKWAGLPIFALVMFAVFWISQVGPGLWLADLFSGWLTAGQELVAEAISGGGELNIWGSILVDGIIGGVIAVVGFLPLVMVMYFLIALLEDCGYMARATVVLDPIFKCVGLSGKSIIPFVIGTGCAIPGVMACRTIRDERERRATAMLAPFMPCGAKLPVIALFAGVFFGDSPIVGTAMYFVGILIILISALLVNLLTGNKNKKSYFIIELPEYKAPSLVRAGGSMCERGVAYIVKAGTVILVCNFAVHLAQTFTWSFQPAESAADSILAAVATPFAYLFAPVVGVVAWQFAAAAITGFIAKENVVGTLAVCFGISNLISVDELVMVEGSAASIAEVFGISSVGALAFLMFNLFSPPCFAAIGAMNAELKSKKWLFAGLALQFAVGFSIGFLVYFFGTLFAGGDLGAAWISILGWAMILVIAIVITSLIIRRELLSKRAAASDEKLREGAAL